MKPYRTLSLLVAALIVTALATSPPAHAGTTKVLLVGTNTPYEIGGTAALTTRGKYEDFAVRVFAALPDGTMLSVAIVKKGEMIEIAKLPIELGSGIVRLNNKLHVSPVFPLGGIQEILVFRGKEQVLRGTVPTLPN